MVVVAAIVVKMVQFFSGESKAHGNFARVPSFPRRLQGRAPQFHETSGRLTDDDVHEADDDAGSERGVGGEA